MKDIQKDMLLYWSGEADETTMRRVTESAWNGILKRGPILRTSMKWTQSSNPAKKTSPVEFQLVERGFWMKSSKRRCSGKATNQLLQSSHSPDGPPYLFTSTVAAAFTVLAAVYSLLIYSNNLTQEISKNQPPSSQKEVDDIPYVDRMTLSKRLLEPSVSFRRERRWLGLD